ncbi:probable LRR receptor-like serine/threonine-protein kinase At3g47570 isoform X2 [Brachypodium distachyon]|uniref:probable LRR receptor-like serine/threonine-protein kinase At3g47570 isoform X2 n=1 Tax=Brachypodium distachyon TaxID=15368 RepID=UPI00071D5FDA|nr:probable LRR receptor-like serine/threonine-protein kinase At3g47570 isoform X2 [Brachypodium distachyon]|eukprot:XP_014758490.1 probable LRR receptor-like serine/threonine-protein kinase At3g47570 isoform X2 [Brachypodium distachyon]
MASASVCIKALALLATVLILATLADESSNNREALLCLNSRLSIWNSTTSPDFCTWRGVTCTETTQPPAAAKVMALDMEALGLTGDIPPCISNLTSLVRIHLPNNQLSGHLPPELGQLTRLRYLNLSTNVLTGEIPVSLSSCAGLEVLVLSRNSIGGAIPPELGALRNLSYLDLAINKLSGTLPPSVGNLSSLTALLLSQNQLQGNIPDLSKISGLQFLDLSYNSLSGTVPTSIYKLSLLTFLGLANNNLGGTLPSDMGNSLSNINILMMSNNHFEGNIPASLANASKLEFMYLGNNSLSGVIPSFGAMMNLQVVMLHSNQLEAGDWTFFSSLANCTRLKKLNLGGNNLRGDFPVNSVADLPKTLDGLTLQSNYISGTIPLEIGNLSKISLLYLDDNLFTGPIPPTLGQLHNLFILKLSKNMFSGEIPPSIGNLNQLSELYLQENQLSGSVPTSLAGCQKLVALNLSSNTLTGNISGLMFSKLNQLSWLLDLSHNQFTYSIPVELGSLMNLGSLNLSHNKLAGKIPSTLGACVRLESLRLEGNLLQGSIPQSLANLKGVKVLDFSRNNLSVPTGGVFTGTNNASVQGNPHLCSSVGVNDFPRCSTLVSKRKHKFIVPLLAALSGLVGVALILRLFFSVFNVLRKKKRKSSESIDHTYMEMKRLTYNDVSKATNSFSPANIVGSGQSGTVYKGQMDGEDTMVAVKVFKLDQYGAVGSFVAECKALQNIRHRNLVKVITACSTYDPMGNEFKALVFEYMANGSLENRLHAKFHKHNADLGLGVRICIAVDIASSLEYLHNQCIPPVVHCNLKPSNILFDDEDTAYVCDFGLARLIRGYSSGVQSNSTSTVGPRGSIGYIAPEYGMGSPISTEGDVYSYGIIILEMLTGRRPTDEAFRDGLTLRKYVGASLSKVEDILHPSLIAEMRHPHADHTPKAEEYRITTRMGVCALQLLKLGQICSEELPKDRPSMHEIYSEVIAIKEAFFSMNSY